jgi:hypothetical protein
MSWMSRVEELQESDMLSDDVSLIYRWIALNSLYGRWDANLREPVPDRQSLELFIRRLSKHDQDALIPTTLKENRKLLESLISDEYLCRYYWKEPGDSAARRAHNGVHKLRGWLREGQTRTALEASLDRAYLARCQLVHGAATYGGKLNRTPVRRCARFLELVLPVFSTIIIDHGWRDDWGELCYPPE